MKTPAPLALLAALALTACGPTAAPVITDETLRVTVPGFSAPLGAAYQDSAAYRAAVAACGPGTRPYPIGFVKTGRLTGDHTFACLTAT